MRVRATASLLLVFVVAFACGTTRIAVSDPRARIIVDGEEIGEGEGKIKRMGFPGSVDVVIERQGAPVLATSIKREFTAVTLLAGLFTLYTGLLWGWQYPEELVLELPDVEKKKVKSSWGESASEKPPSPWDKTE